MKKRVVSLILLAASALTVTLCAVLQAQSQRMADKIIRLHVVANSDTSADQAVKLAVRDAVLREAGRVLDGAEDPKQAVAAQLPARCAEREEHAGFARLLAEEQPGGVGGEYRAAQHRQYKHPHNLLAAVAALGQNGEDGGRAHHARIGSDEQHGKEAAPREQPVLPAVFAAQRRIDFGKGFHRLVTSCKVKLFARSAHEIGNCGEPQLLSLKCRKRQFQG